MREAYSTSIRIVAEAKVEWLTDVATWIPLEFRVLRRAVSADIAICVGTVEKWGHSGVLNLTQ